MRIFTQIKALTVVLTALVLGSGAVFLTAQEELAATDWPVAGHDLANTRNQPRERKINTTNVASLEAKWTFAAGGNISATPVVLPDVVYTSDWAGNLYAIKRHDGSLIWSHSISDYDHFVGAFSRVSPAVHNEALIFGDLQATKIVHNGANVIAVNRRTGALLWITQVDKHPAAVITGSPVVMGDVVFVGVSSIEESLATDPSYPCCSFRGSLVALNANSGEIVWQTYTVPDNGGKTDGYSGGAIWQPPAIEPRTSTLYVGTGNNYEVPDTVKQCVESSPMAQQPACFAADDHYDAAMAVDTRTGQIKWSKRLQGVDVWTVACVQNPNPMSCPLPESPDYDLSGSGPNLFTHLNLVGFGQKSGIYWAFKADSGDIAWSTVVGPGATLGGIEWGTAADEHHIYVAISNGSHKSYPLIDGTTTTGGAWSSLDAATGKILWQTADPQQALDIGAVSLANGVLYAPSFSGNMHALDSATGKILWTFNSGGSVIDGPSIVNGAVYWGSGYDKITGGIANNKLFAFTLP